MDVNSRLFSARGKKLSARGKKRRSRRLIVLITLILSVSVLLIGLAEGRGWPFLRIPLQNALSTALQRPVLIGEDFKLRLAGRLSLHTNSLLIEGNDAVDRPLLNAEQLTFIIPYTTLWQARKANPATPLRISHLEIGRLTSHLIRDASGHVLGSKQPTIHAPENNARIVPPRFDRLRLHDGDIHVNDARYQLSLRAKVSIHEDSITNDDKKANVIHIRAEGKYREHPLTADIRSSGLMPWLNAAEESPILPVDMTVKTGDTQVGFLGHFHFDGKHKVPVLKGEFTANPLMLKDLAPALGVVPKENKTPTATGNRWLPQRNIDLQALHLVNAELKVRLKRVNAGRFFDRPLSPLNADIILNNGVLKLRNLQARTADGEIHGDMSLDASARRPRWHFDLAWSGIELGKWLAAKNPLANASGPPTPNVSNSYINGELHGQAHLTGTGASLAEMLGSLDGSLRLWVKQGAISQLLVEAMGLDIAEGLGLVVKGDEKLAMHCAILLIDARKGVLIPEVALLDTPDSTLFGAGDVSLAQERLNLTVTAKPKDKSPLTLRSPLILRGTFTQPELELQNTTIGLKVLGAAVLSALSPLAAMLPLVDIGEKDEAGGCSAAMKRLQADAQ